MIIAVRARQALCIFFKAGGKTNEISLWNKITRGSGSDQQAVDSKMRPKQS